ncbi:MAG: zinc ribbon domain-containing protein [Candidatus Eremiobacteraeota bacterium]|nr:zinc ribbon domain-containing protein [Candidatus Eremiobacteraeota bacterium]
MALKIFKCTRCGNVFERLIRSSEEKKKEPCPHCGSEETKHTFLGQFLGKVGCFEGG